MEEFEDFRRIAEFGHREAEILCCPEDKKCDAQLPTRLCARCEVLVHHECMSALTALVVKEPESG